MKKFLIAILTAAFLCSCEFRYEPDLDDRGPLLFIECIGGSQDTTLFTHRVAAPYVNNMDQSYAAALNNVDFRINGVAQTVKDSIILCSYKPGDIITLKASCPGAPDIKSETTVPPIPAVRNVKMDKYDREGAVYMRFSVDLDGGPQDGCFYGIQLLERVINERVYTDTLGNVLERTTSGDIFYRSIVNPAADDDLFEAVDNLFVLQIGFDGRQIRQSYDCPMNLCTANELKREGTDVYLYADPDYDTGAQQEFELVYLGDETDPEKQLEDWENWELVTTNRCYRTSCKIQYKLIFRTLSPEFYYYAKAQYLNMYDNLAGMGLSPVNFTYSNIKGGAGVLGACMSYESEWFDNPYYVEDYEDNPIF